MHKILISLYIIHLLKCSTCFEHYPAHLQEVYVVIIYMQSLVSSLSAGDCLVHQLRRNSSFLTGAQNSHLQRVTIPEIAYIQLQRRPCTVNQSSRLILILIYFFIGVPLSEYINPKIWTIQTQRI
jgi:hypothetical protein